MAQAKKRGFTIVELVIVIAVMAILAGVLIPTFVNVVKKADEVKDISLINSLNKSVAAGSVTQKPQTMHQALQIVKGDGFDLEKIKATATDNKILWDSVNNCFVYLKNNKVTYIPNSAPKGEQSGVALWQITEKTQAASAVYSNYLENGYTKPTDNLTTGVDVGDNAGLNVTYVGGASLQTVTIRTNGGRLNVNAPQDTVHHYDFVMTLVVEAVSETHCYYEHGFVGKLEKFSVGKFVATNESFFNQTKNEVAAVLGAKGDFSDGGKFEQHIYDDNGVSVFDNKVTSNEHVHNLVETIVASSCTAVGNKHVECATCGYKVDTPLELSSHKWVDIEKVEPTCTQKGRESGKKCSVCNAVEGCAEIATLPHVKGETILKSETAEESGKIQTKCAVCHDIIDEWTIVIPSDEVLTATCQVRIVHGKGYKTIGEAIQNASVGDTVKLLTDITFADVLIVAEDKNIGLDLSGKTISGAQGGFDEPTHTEYLILNLGTLQFVKNGTISATTQDTTFGDGVDKFAALCNKGSIGTVKDVTFDVVNSHGVALLNRGSITSISNCVLHSRDDSYPFYNYALVNGGNIGLIKDTELKAYADDNGTRGRDTYAINNSGVIGDVQNTKAYSSIGTAITNSGFITVTGGRFYGALSGGGIYVLGGGLFTHGTSVEMWKAGFVQADNADDTYKYTVAENASEYAKYPYVAAVTNSDGTEVRYKSLARATYDAANGGTVKLIQTVVGRQAVLRGNVTLDLNGYGLEAQNKSWGYTVCVRGEDVKIVDSSAANTGYIGNRAEKTNGYTVLVVNKAKLTMLGGTIYGQSQKLSGSGTTSFGVAVQGGEFVLNGGTIVGGNFGGVDVTFGGTFRMNGGHIVDDLGASYGAVCVDSDSGASSFCMSGGKIEAAKYVFYLRKQGGSAENLCNLTISGGEVVLHANESYAYVFYGDKEANVDAKNFAVTYDGTYSKNVQVIKAALGASLYNVTINGVNYAVYPTK